MVGGGSEKGKIAGRHGHLEVDGWRDRIRTKMTEVLAGLVERVTFHNPENGFCVLRVKARGHRDLVTTVGHAARRQSFSEAGHSGN